MIFQNAEVFYQGKFQILDVRTENGMIAEIGTALHGSPATDCTGKKLLPGFVELHSHGCAGYDFSTATDAQLRTMLDYYAQHGITSVCATAMTMGLDEYEQAVRRIRAVMEDSTSNQQVIGINMEGPFLAAEKKGAHDASYLIPVSEEIFERLDSASGGNIRLVDIDPDDPKAMDFIQKYSSEKVISLAHTSCSYETAMQAFSCGAKHITHLFNAMNGLHHREPGIIGALSDADVCAEIICDGIHVHPAVIRMMFRLCPEKMILISDSMSACGLKDGQYELGGLPVTVRKGKATLSDGTIAGSTTNVYDCMCNAIQFGVPAEQAVLSATCLPAKALHLEHEIGRIETGCRANLVLADPDYKIEAVYLNGNKVPAK